MEQKIPKIIHYCWFGKKPFPEDIKKYILSWKKYCPDYEIIEWNESNFDIHCNLYVKEAYEAQKWAFVTDYVRLYALLNYGGIYMDTDVEVLKPLDEFLVNEAFSGFESSKNIPTGIMGAEKGFPLFKEFLAYYDNRHFKNEDGSLDTTPNVITITNICQKYGFVSNNEQQSVNGFVLYPSDFFCPKSYISQKIKLTTNSHTIHHFTGTWLSENQKELLNWQRKWGEKLGKIFYIIHKFPSKFHSKYKEVGFFKACKLMMDKLKKRS